jgi:DNA polymerase-1
MRRRLAAPTQIAENEAMFLLLDGNNLAWAGYYALERAMKPEDDERRHRVALLGLAGMVLGSIARAGEAPGDESTAKTKLTRVALCFDEGRPLRRRAIFPEYQLARDNDAKFTTNEPTILGAIDEFCGVAERCLPIEVLHDENTEADDLIAGLVLKNPKVQKRIISNDRDFLQLLDTKTTVYQPVKKAVVGADGAIAALALKPNAFPRGRIVQYRALTGDPSDNVPGVPGVGSLSAAKLLARAPVERYYGDSRAVREALGRRSDVVEIAFRDGLAQAVVERNCALMDLRLPSPVWDRIDAATTRGEWDRAAFEAWLDAEKLRAVERETLLARLEQLAAA